MIEEVNGEEKQQNSDLDSKGVAESTPVPTIIPTIQSTVPPQDASTQPSTQVGQGNPPQPPQQLPPRGEQAPESPDHSEEQLQIDRDMLNATRSMVKATYWGIIVAALAAAVFLGQLKTMSYQTQILGTQVEGEAASSSLSAVQTQTQLSIAQRQAKAAQDSVNAINAQMQLDQRAWVGVQAMSGRTDPQSDGLYRFQVEIILKNTGKTPAIRMGGEMIALGKSRKDPIPDFDKESAASAKELKERFQEILKRTPKESGASLVTQLQNIGTQMVIPKGDVLAPEATRAVSLTPAANYFIADPAKGKPDPGVAYILGKFTYFDIFQTKERSTKLCVMWRGGNTQPQICPEGNGMD